MPTISQLVRKGRKRQHVKITPTVRWALGWNFNSNRRKYVQLEGPLKRGVCTRVWTVTDLDNKRLTQVEDTFLYSFAGPANWYLVHYLYSEMPDPTKK